MKWNLFSSWLKRGDYAIETPEGWEKCMQEILLKETNATNKKERQERTLSRMKWLVMLNVVVAAGIVYFSFDSTWSLDTSVLAYVSVPIVLILILYVYSSILKYSVKKLTDVLAELNKQKNAHIATIHNVKGCLVDVNRLIVKYNIDTKQAVLPELKNALTEIETLLHVIYDLVELPLCEDCRYYTRDKRLEILARIPKKYQKEFENVEPKHAEDIAKPLDEKVMSLLEDKDDSLPIQTIPLMLQNKEVDEVKIEEITDEKKEEELRERHPAASESCVC